MVAFLFYFSSSSTRGRSGGCHCHNPFLTHSMSGRGLECQLEWRGSRQMVWELSVCHPSRVATPCKDFKSLHVQAGLVHVCVCGGGGCLCLCVFQSWFSSNAYGEVWMNCSSSSGDQKNQGGPVHIMNTRIWECILPVWTLKRQGTSSTFKIIELTTLHTIQHV